MAGTSPAKGLLDTRGALAVTLPDLQQAVPTVQVCPQATATGCMPLISNWYGEKQTAQSPPVSMLRANVQGTGSLKL